MLTRLYSIDRGLVSTILVIVIERMLTLPSFAGYFLFCFLVIGILLSQWNN